MPVVMTATDVAAKLPACGLHSDGRRLPFEGVSAGLMTRRGNLLRRFPLRFLVKSAIPGTRGDHCRGFTLIEILVATMILSIALTVIMQLFSGGLRSARLSQDYTRGVFHAREKMEEILLADDVSTEAADGVFDDGYRWQTGVELVDTKEGEATEPLPVDTYLVTVRVSWPSGVREKKFELNTLKLQVRTESSG